MSGGGKIMRSLRGGKKGNNKATLPDSIFNQQQCLLVPHISSIKSVSFSFFDNIFPVLISCMILYLASHTWHRFIGKFGIVQIKITRKC